MAEQQQRCETHTCTTSLASFASLLLLCVLGKQAYLAECDQPPWTSDNQTRGFDLKAIYWFMLAAAGLGCRECCLGQSAAGGEVRGIEAGKGRSLSSIGEQQAGAAAGGLELRGCSARSGADGTAG